MSRKIQFVKMSGAGNDFVVVDNRRGIISRRSDLARRLCERTEGIGADGMLLVERSENVHYRMRYYNSDGSDGGMCGNGGRCIAWFAYTEGIAPKVHVFEALGRRYHAKIVDSERVVLGFPDPSGLLTHVRTASGRFPEVSFVHTGSPHVVARISKRELERLDIIPEGRSLRWDPAFRPEGANVNFIYRIGSRSIRMRTYERGVENETKACGTGSIASAIVASKVWRVASPVRVRTSGGEVLVVGFRAEGDSYHDISLEGSARKTFEGHILV